MKKEYPSRTRIERAKAHTRAMARRFNYDGEVQCYYDKVSDEFFYEEFVGNGGWIQGDDIVFIASARVYRRW